MRSQRSVPMLDLYLAATMRPSEDIALRLSSVGVTREDLNQVRRAAEAAGLTAPARVTIDLLRRRFGVPLREESRRWIYGLVLWPEHEYEWEVEEWGGASHSGFRLHNLAQLPSWLPPGAEHAVETFKPWFHTSHDVREVLGDPEAENSWGPAWGWHYSQTNGRDLVFDFDYGLLRQVRDETPAPRGAEDQP